MVYANIKCSFQQQWHHKLNMIFYDLKYADQYSFKKSKINKSIALSNKLCTFEPLLLQTNLLIQTFHIYCNYK